MPDQEMSPSLSRDASLDLQTFGGKPPPTLGLSELFPKGTLLGLFTSPGAGFGGFL